MFSARPRPLLSREPGNGPPANLYREKLSHRVLKRVAERLLAHFRSVDIFCRLGRDGCAVF
ncbi:MAG: hypothetical protein J6A42_02335 [Firmicutes bacterium]|nr:hypothetical protein [Bacillota bacterium]